MPLDPKPLAPALGAEITGVDLAATVDGALLAQIRAALLEHQVLVFRDQTLAPEQQIAFARLFGELQIRISPKFLMSEHNEILILSNRVVDGKEQGASTAYAGEFWHSDLTYAARPSMGSMLHALEVAEEGGDTAWANSALAYDTLPAETRRRIEGLRAIHVRDRQRNPRTPLPEEFAEEAGEYYSIEVPDGIHPVVRTHPETGHRSLFVSPRFTIAIEGMDDSEAQPLLDELFAHQIRPDFIYRHIWRRGDLVFWDNRCTTHFACGGIVPPGIRHLHRTSVQGDVPF